MYSTYTVRLVGFYFYILIYLNILKYTVIDDDDDVFDDKNKGRPAGLTLYLFLNEKTK